MQLISVVMAEENSNAYLDTTKLLDYGFSKFHNVELLKTNDYQKNCVVTQKYKNKTLDIDTVNIYPQKDIILNLPDSINKEDLKLTAKLPEKISAPVNKNKSVGQISVIYKNQILEKINLVPEENINVLDEKVIAKINRNQVIHKIFFTSIKILSYAALFIGIIIIIAILIRKFNIWRNKKRRRF